MTREWAVKAEDVLWRRSKLGLRFNQEEAGALNLWMQSAGGDGVAGRRAGS
jgi:glycerol-3-phosphate dehydrogenase